MTGHQINLRIMKLTKLKKVRSRKDALSNGPSPALRDFLLTMEKMSKDELREFAVSLGRE